MKVAWRLFLFPLVLSALCSITPAWAAPERLSDDVPDAVPDQPHSWSFGYSYEALNLEGPLNNDNVAHDYFKLRYTFNPKTAVTIRYGNHHLNNGLALSNPLFDNCDSAESFSFDLNLNLLNVAAKQENPDENQAFEAGSAFGVGVSGSLFQMDMGDLNSDDSLLRAYLVYTTDLSPELRAHTIFATSRLSGDSASGSMNRIGAGLDYTLIDGRHPLVLMANGVLDVYNFRQPDFNTSRISRFDVGLRYRVAEDWYASLGYTTVNDSENDASGSGIFASVQFVDEPTPCVECVPLEIPPEETPAPAEQANLPPAEPAPSNVILSQPLLADTGEAEAEPAPEPEPEAEPETKEPATVEDDDAAAEEPAVTEDDGKATEESAAAEDETTLLDDTEKVPASAPGDEEPLGPSGVLVPDLPEDEAARQASDNEPAQQIATQVPSNRPHHTRPEDIMLRTPTDPNAASIEALIDQLLVEDPAEVTPAADEAAEPAESAEDTPAAGSGESSNTSAGTDG
ncbi:hypothetical protein JW859_13905 [bacterium]|nr:hypothetical protein [bacterium]